AYCATPHTSYSISSMMLGKMTRPLTQFGVGLGSDTLAESLRRYGYKTAAFYPPAVFFIDADTFRPLAEKKLGFEYAKVEFADPALRLQQLKEYLTTEKGEPVFAWVHLFEPHEPYVKHSEFDFGNADVDRYDSEIAAADAGIRTLVEAFLEKKPESIVIVTADHGEEFGEHDGRYHGTTVYEEQVRVPLIVMGRGVSPGKRIQAPVQTVDLYPTLLSAVGVPRTARIVGRDLGPLLTGKTPDEGSAFADTDKMAMLAHGTDRLVCRSSMMGTGLSKGTSTCVLYDLARDPKELHDVSRDRPDVFERRKQELRALRESFGRFERTELPESLRRAIQGEEEALFEILPLLEDVSDAVRRKTAEVLLSVPPHTDRPEDGLEAAKQTALMRASEREKRDDVRSWMKLAMLRSRVASRSPSDLGGPSISLESQWEELSRQNGEVRLQLRLLQWEEALPQEDKRTTRPPENSLRELVGAWQTSGPPQGAMDGPTWRRLTRVLYRAEDPRALLALRDTWEASDSYPQLRMELLAAYPPTCAACDATFAPVFKKTRDATQHVSVREALERWFLTHKTKP
ncbi:MAG: sulfatase, partial [Polyangiaceae bacterium]|nr:sulfatase [Polyangiaceae bacterium]